MASEDIVFAAAFNFVIGHEGGLSLLESDPGNWTGGSVGAGKLRGTKWGISAAAYPNKDIPNLTIDQAKAIYWTDYWLKVRGPDLPPSLALLAFDAATNNGPTRAVRWLQMAVGTQADGFFGPITLRAVMAQTETGPQRVKLCAEYLARRIDWMARLPTWEVFGLGWSRRLALLPYQSMSMPRRASL